MDSNLAEQREETRWGTEQDVCWWRSLELVALEGSSALCSHAKVTESHSYPLLEAAIGRVPADRIGRPSWVPFRNARAG
jgi:hypothetical protein